MPFRFDPSEEGGRSIGAICRGENASAPLPGAQGKFGELRGGAYVAFRPAGARLRLIVGKVVENMPESRALLVRAMEGSYGPGRLRVFWTTPANQPTEVVQYKGIFREVSLMKNGALAYGDLRAMEGGGYQLVVQEPDEGGELAANTLEEGYGCCHCGLQPRAPKAECPTCGKAMHMSCVHLECGGVQPTVAEEAEPAAEAAQAEKRVEGFHDSTFSINPKRSSLMSDASLVGENSTGVNLALERPVAKFDSKRWKRCSRWAMPDCCGPRLQCGYPLVRWCGLPNQRLTLLRVIGCSAWLGVSSANRSR